MTGQHGTNFSALKQMKYDCHVRKMTRILHLNMTNISFHHLVTCASGVTEFTLYSSEQVDNMYCAYIVQLVSGSSVYSISD